MRKILDSTNVVVEVVKKALDGNGTIVRLYETFGRRTQGAKLKLGFKAEKLYECNLLEDTLREVALDGQTATFSLRPYEIRTFRVL